MLNQRIKPRFVWSSVLFLAVMVIAIIGKNAGQPSPIHGESDYAIILNATNAPTTSETYVEANQTVRYTSFEYWDVSYSAGNHGKLGSYGSIWNSYSSPITSITGVTATFTTDGTFVVSTTYDHTTFFDFELTSGVRQELPYLPYFLEFYAGDTAVFIESIVITYTCSPHEEPLDQYTVTWFDEDGETVLEIDSNVAYGTFPSYDGPTPTKPYDSYEEASFTFSGWNSELSTVTSHQAYFATYTMYYGTFALINEDTEYELRNVSDKTLTAITIPSTFNGLPVTSINQSVFENFVSLTSVTLPSTLTNIDSEAFAGCTSLTSVTIPENVSFIGVNAFVGCTSLTAINVSSSNVTYSSLDGVLFNNDQTQLLSFPQGKPVTTYAIPDGVISLREFAFVGCSGLESVSFPSSLTTIGNAAFIACSYLDNVVLPDTVTTFGTGVFVNCAHLATITLPSGMTSIPGSFFYNCESLANITLPSGVTTIENQAFEDCIRLPTINLPTGLTSIGSYAFRHCVLLANVTLPEGLLTIEDSAFSDCDAFTAVTIPASVTSIGGYAFSDCNLLTAVNVHVDNLNYASIDGVLFTEDLSTLILYPTGKLDADYTIPASVTTIELNAFRNNTHLTSVIIPSTVTTILGYAFTLCTNLTLNCAASAKPAGWDVNWNASARPVVWGYVE